MKHYKSIFKESALTKEETALIQSIENGVIKTLKFGNTTFRFKKKILEMSAAIFIYDVIKDGKFQYTMDLHMNPTYKFSKIDRG